MAARGPRQATKKSCGKKESCVQQLEAFREIGPIASYGRSPGSGDIAPSTHSITRNGDKVNNSGVPEIFTPPVSARHFLHTIDSNESLQV